MLLLIASCAPLPSDNSPGSTPRPTIDPGSATTIPGQIVVMGTDGNLYLVENGEDVTALTEDANMDAAQAANRIAYLHPAWSPDGWLAFVRQENTAGSPEITSEILALPPDGGTPATILRSDTQRLIYGYWAPAACQDGPGCQRFAYLLTEEDTLSLQLARLNLGRDMTVANEAIALGQPFFFSWASDGSAILLHQDDERMAVFDIAQGGVTRQLFDQPGDFQAPAWSPTGTGQLFARAVSGGSRIALSDEDGLVDLSPALSDATRFSWSPDGQYVAYANGSATLSPVTIVRRDGTQSRTFDDLDQVVAFFWSPDSTRLAVITLELYEQPLPEARDGIYARSTRQEQPPEAALAWSVITVSSGEITRYNQFLPTAEQFSVLQYFDQYAQSHRIWSPDSRYLVYADISTDAFGNEYNSINLLDTYQPNTRPRRVMGGYVAFFSSGL